MASCSCACGSALADGDPQLPFDQVLAGDGLGHRMLDLQAGVHFHEPDAVGAQALGCIGDELDRAGADIIHRLRRLHRRGAQRRARGVRPCPARALPRSPSGGGAAANSRARTDARHCRGCRRTPALRYGAGWRCISPAAPGRRRRTMPPRAGRTPARRRNPPRRRPRRMPLPPPPATALISTG